MPHMANLPWLFFYFLIGIFLTLFWAKENFSFSLKIKHPQDIKITKKTFSWKW